MAVRHFDGVDDYIAFPSPAVGGAAYTFAALVQRNSSTSGLSFFAGREGAGGGNNIEAMGFDANQWGVGNDHNIVSNSALGNVVPGDGWVIVVGSMPDSVGGATVLPRLSVYRMDAGTWEHFYPDSSYDLAAADPGGIMRVGYLRGLESFKGAFSLAALAYWSTDLTDTEVEALTANLATQDWADVRPGPLEYLAEFNQADVATAVVDLSGKGLDQADVVGTDAMTGNDPAGWTFGVSADPGPEQHSGSAVVSGGGNVSASGTKRASASAVATGAGAASASGRKIARGSGAVSGAGSTTASGHGPATGVRYVTDLPSVLALDPRASTATVAARVTTLSLAARSTSAALDDRTTEVILDG